MSGKGREIGMYVEENKGNNSLVVTYRNIDDTSIPLLLNKPTLTSYFLPGSTRIHFALVLVDNCNIERVLPIGKEYAYK